MGSAAEAEVATLHMNAQEAIPLRICLEELGHNQGATQIRTDNLTAKGFVRGTVKQKKAEPLTENSGGSRIEKHNYNSILYGSRVFII